MTARFGVATLDKGMAIVCEPRLDPNRHWGSECRLIRVRVSEDNRKRHAGSTELRFNQAVVRLIISLLLFTNEFPGQGQAQHGLGINNSAVMDLLQCLVERYPVDLDQFMFLRLCRYDC